VPLPITSASGATSPVTPAKTAARLRMSPMTDPSLDMFLASLDPDANMSVVPHTAL